MFCQLAVVWKQLQSQRAFIGRKISGRGQIKICVDFSVVDRCGLTCVADVSMTGGEKLLSGVCKTAGYQGYSV